MTEFITWLLAIVQSVDPFLRNLLASSAIFAETSLFIGLLIPGDTVVLVASSAVRDFGDFTFLLLSVLLGSLVGESVGFWVGRLFGERIRRSRLGQKIGEKNWQMADTFVETRGGIAVAVSRFLPVLHSLVPVVAGMTRMTYRTFISWTAAACTVWAGAYISLGWFAGASWANFASDLKWGGVIFVALILAIAVLVHFGKKRIEKSAEAMIEKGERARAALAGAEPLDGQEGESKN